jgi:hypothetical protein
MQRAEFLKGLDEAVELPPGTLQGNEKLEDLENWNSMAMLGYIALADTASGAKLTPRQIRDCETVEDLVQLAKIGTGQ